MSNITKALRRGLSSGLPTVLAILAALILGGVIMVVLGYNPGEAYGELLRGAFVGAFNFGSTLERFTPLLLTGLAFTVSATAGVFNVGVEGQLYLGAFAATWVGLFVKGVPPFIHITLAILFAMVVGALWGAIPGALRAYYNANEICTTIMLNYVAILFTSYLVNRPFSGGTGAPETKTIASSAFLPWIMPPSRANIGLFIAIAAMIITYWIIHRTSFGYEIRAVGQNTSFSEYVGIKPKRTVLMAMMLSGAIAGLAGSIEILGINRRFVDSFSPGYGFDGIVVAALSGNNITVLPIFSFFLAVLKSGAAAMERFTGVPKELLGTIEAIFIILTASKVAFEIRRRRADEPIAGAGKPGEKGREAEVTVN
jgi:ABC-type uncharacterized transport system permease subunit